MKLPKTYKSEVTSPTALLLPFQYGRRWVGFQHIVRLEGIGNYTSCVFSDGSALLVALSLRHLQDRLPADGFVRAHRKHLLNRDYIARVSPAKFAIWLTNGDCIEIARRRVAEFRDEAYF
jgi:DNA-binding LytR/AlgR family response regulator